jgi:hypothetical protein
MLTISLRTNKGRVFEFKAAAIEIHQEPVKSATTGNNRGTPLNFYLSVYKSGTKKTPLATYKISGEEFEEAHAKLTRITDLYADATYSLLSRVDYRRSRFVFKGDFTNNTVLYVARRPREARDIFSSPTV